MVFFPAVPYFAVTLPRHGVSVTPLDDRLLAVSYFSSIHARHRETKIHVHCRRPGDVHTEAQGTVRAPPAPPGVHVRGDDPKKSNWRSRVNDVNGPKLLARHPRSAITLVGSYSNVSQVSLTRRRDQTCFSAHLGSCWPVDTFPIRTSSGERPIMTRSNAAPVNLLPISV
jgi:hypothetical protein